MLHSRHIIWTVIKSSRVVKDVNVSLQFVIQSQRYQESRTISLWRFSSGGVNDSWTKVLQSVTWMENINMPSLKSIEMPGLFETHPEGHVVLLYFLCTCEAPCYSNWF